MARKLGLGIAIVVAALVAPTTVMARTPYSYHTIHARTAVASFNVTQGHYGITVWVFTTEGRYSLKPGSHAINGTSSYTDVEIVVSDLTRPSGKGYLQVADWNAQVAATPRFRGALAGASVSATLTLIDRLSGETGTARVQVVWTATGPSETPPSHWHIRYPWLVTILSNSNDNHRPATATGTVALDGVTLISNGVDEGAVLESVKYNCRQVGYRQSIDFGQCV